MYVLRRCGVDVPGQVAVTGFDDIPMARHVQPLMTTVRQPIGELGETAFEVLYTMISGEEPAERDITLPTRLACRESCGCQPGSGQLAGVTELSSARRAAALAGSDCRWSISPGRPDAGRTRGGRVVVAWWSRGWWRLRVLPESRSCALRVGAPCQHRHRGVYGLYSALGLTIAVRVTGVLALWLMVPRGARWVGSRVDGAGWGASYGRSGTDDGIDSRYLGDRRRGDDRPGGLACRGLRRRQLSDPSEPSAAADGCAGAGAHRGRGVGGGVVNTGAAARRRAAGAGARAGTDAGNRRGAGQACAAGRLLRRRRLLRDG